MATIDDGELCLSIEGATEEQLRAGIRAARGIFVAAGCSLYDAFKARFDREGFDMSDDIAEISDETADMARVLDEAELAAARGWLRSEQADITVGLLDAETNGELFPGPRYYLEPGAL